MDAVRQGLVLMLVVSLPVLLTALLVGGVVSVLQALTQVTDPTLSFVPKILAVVLVLVITLPWMMDMLVEFGRAMFSGEGW